jgi:hypothetical protein
MKSESDSTRLLCRWRATSSIAFVLASVLLAACASASSHAAGGTNSTATSSSTTASSASGCPPTSEVNTAMGGTFALQSSQPFGGGVQCVYASGSHKLDIDINPNSSESTLPAALSSVVTTVPGLGNWAFWEPIADTFEAYKGTTFVSIVWATLGGATPPESSFVDLARQIL